MRKVLVALTVIALSSLAPAVAFASGAASSHRGGDGHGMDMDEDMHGGGGGGKGDGHENARTVKGARKIKVTAGRFRYVPKNLTVAAGDAVTIVMKSTDLFHDFFVKGEGHVVGAKRKQTRKGGLRIDEPGTYKYWCTVPGHRAAGMKGTITVE